MMITEVKVKGDSGEVYTVSVNEAGTSTCTCPAFRYRTKTGAVCKHQNFVLDVLLAASEACVA